MKANIPIQTLIQLKKKYIHETYEIIKYSKCNTRRKILRSRRKDYINFPYQAITSSPELHMKFLERKSMLQNSKNQK